MFTNHVNSPCLFRQSKLGCSLIFYDAYDSCVSNKQTRNQVEEIGAHVHNTVCSPRRCVARATGRRPRRKWRLRNRASWSRESTFLFASSSRNRFHIAPSQFLLGRCAFRVFVSRFRLVDEPREPREENTTAHVSHRTHETQETHTNTDCNVPYWCLPILM